jgi:pimeloyl-ACP methyl ester carboxylesterase
VTSTGPRSIDQGDWDSRKERLQLDGSLVAFVEQAGSDPALVLLHGFTDTGRSYSLLAPYLAGRRLLIPDLRGHGASRGPEPAHLADFAVDVLALVEARGLARPVLVGHSLGTMVAIEACLQRPGAIAGLVLIAGSLRPGIEEDSSLAVGVSKLRDPIQPNDPFYAYWHHCRPEVPKPFLDKLAEEASRMPAARWRSTLDIIRRIDLRHRAEALSAVPCLIINGTDDPLFGPAHRLALAASLPGAAIVDMAGCGHNPHWEEPKRIAQIVTRHFPVAGMTPRQART